MNLTFKIIIWSFLQKLAYPSDQVIYLFDKILNIFIITVLWQLIINNTTHNIVVSNIVGYLLISQAISGLFFVNDREFGSNLRKSIKQGTINNDLLKPINLLKYKYLSTVGEMSIDIIVSIVLLIIGLIIVPPVSITSATAFIIVCICSFLISMSMNIFDGILTFYITDAQSIIFSIGHIIRLTSGLWIPITFFPESIQKILLLTPFSWTIYGPFKMLSENSFNLEFIQLISIPIIWAIVMYTLSIYLWNKSIKQYEAIGI